MAISRAGRRSFIAPVNALHLYYKLTHMVDESSDPTFGSAPQKEEGQKTDQLDLPLRKVSSR
ncbi:MAG TPA: hypothetical protein VFT21_05645 [Gemmatimonadaceae bacterium]|nr:hypothetical protein [Gemmatimonadaceae bacterium]